MVASEILKQHHLRNTDCRRDVLGLFSEQDHALSQIDLEDQLPQYDRVTLYRTLHSFLDAGIIHQIPNDSGAAAYGLCHHTCAPQQHRHDHIHFKCNDCGQIQCLDDRHVPSVDVPLGFEVRSVQMILEGRCSKCAG